VSEPAPWGQPRKPARKASRLGFVLWLGAVAILALSLWGLSELFPGRDPSWMDTAYAVQMVAILVAASSGLLFIREIKLKQTIRNILLWIGVMGVLAVGFAHQDQLRRWGLGFRSGLIPGYPVQTATGEMVISESEGGAYLVYGMVNGIRVRFLIDTGASDIVLSPEDAKRVGIDFGLLNFDHSYETANGVGKGARATVRELDIGESRFIDVPVSVNRAEMKSSLLGMAFLRRFKSFSFSDGKLTLVW
jgi:aspartyl protease family protein